MKRFMLGLVSMMLFGQVAQASWVTDAFEGSRYMLKWHTAQDASMRFDEETQTVNANFMASIGKRQRAIFGFRVDTVLTRVNFGPGFYSFGAEDEVTPLTRAAAKATLTNIPGSVLGLLAPKEAVERFRVNDGLNHSIECVVIPVNKQGGPMVEEMSSLTIQFWLKPKKFEARQEVVASPEFQQKLDQVIAAFERQQKTIEEQNAKITELEKDRSKPTEPDKVAPEACLSREKIDYLRGVRYVNCGVIEIDPAGHCGSAQIEFLVDDEEVVRIAQTNEGLVNLGQAGLCRVRTEALNGGKITIPEVPQPLLVRWTFIDERGHKTTPSKWTPTIGRGADNPVRFSLTVNKKGGDQR